MVERIAPALEDDEHVLWSGRPLPMKFGWYHGKWYCLAGTIIAVIAILLGLSTFDRSIADYVQPFKTYGIIVGLGLIAVPVAFARSSAKIEYAITTSHVFRTVGFWRHRLEAASLSDILGFEAKPGWFGSRNVFIEIRPGEATRNAGPEIALRSMAFIAVDDPDEVARVLRYELGRVRSSDRPA